LIGRLSGKILEKQPPLLLVDVNGVGYDVLAPMTTFYVIEEDVVLHTHFAVSETSQQLYGFASKDDRLLFRQLIKVNGVGPKMALGIMSGMNSNEFVRCVTDNNVTALTKVPGVGKKTAERLVVEMRDRLGDWQNEASNSSTPHTHSNTAGPSAGAMVAEAEAALVALGYKPVEAAKLVANVLKEEQVTRSEELIRLSLRRVMPV